ncbi:17556_t:CDS:2, partial [Racocetra fulgida]
MKCNERTDYFTICTVNSPLPLLFTNSGLNLEYTNAKTLFDAALGVVCNKIFPNADATGIAM